MDMPKPGPGHSKMERLAGMWVGQEIMHSSQWDPEGGTATDRNRSRIDLNSFALITDYEQ